MEFSTIIIFEREETMKYDIFENDTYNLYTIETDKFKSAHMEVIFRTPATKENITYLSLLASILMENSCEYPTRKLLARKMCDLYNASIYAVNSRVGGMVLTNFVLDFLDPKYTDKETMEKSIELLFEMILNPNAQDGEFDEVVFERIKRRVALDIDAIKEDPKQASILNAFKELDSNDMRSFNANGDNKILDSITPRKLFKFYENFLENSPRDVYVIGNLDMKTVDKVTRKYAKFNSIPSCKDVIYLDEFNCKNAKVVAKRSELSQTNLVQIYSLKHLSEYEMNYVMPLFNMIFGSGSLESKLYKSLRGENALCYNVTTFYQKYDRALIVHTAIDEDNTKLALKLIKDGMKSMLKADITNEELDNVKGLIITSLNLILDSPNRLIDMYLFKNLVGLPDLETRVDEFKKVTVKDLGILAKKIHLIMTYRMRGE